MTETTTDATTGNAAAAEPEQAKRNRYLEALRTRDLRIMLLAFLVDESGSWAYSVVIAAYVYGRTHSPGWVAAVLACRWVTGMIVGAPAGVLADRYERIRLVQIGAVAGAVVMTGMTVLVASDGPLVLLLVLSVLATVVSAANRPAVSAVLPEIVAEKDLAAANAIFAGLENLVVVVGPALGGLILVLASPAVAVGVNAASFLLGAAIFALARVRSRGDAAAGTGIAAQLGEGWQALRANRVVFILILFLVLDSAVFGAATVIFGPLSQHLGTGSDGYSYLIGANAVGSVIGAAFADRLASRPRLAGVIIVSLTIEAVPMAIVSTTHTPVVAAALQSIVGFGMVIVDVVAITAMQREVPGAVLGRVNAIMTTMFLAGNVVASFAASALFDATNLTTVLIAIGVAFPVLGLLLLPPLIRQERLGAARVEALEPRVALVSALDLFTGATRPVLERLATAATEQHVEPGAVVIAQGDPADALYLLAEGTLAVDVRAESGRVNPRPDVVAPGYVGELGLLRRIPRTATVRARTACTLLRIEGEDFFAALSAGSAASSSMMSLAGERFARFTPPSPLPIDPVPEPAPADVPGTEAVTAPRPAPRRPRPGPGPS